MKLSKPAIFEEQLCYDSYGKNLLKVPDLMGYRPTQKQVEETGTDITILLLAVREVFDQLSKLGNGDCDGNSISNSIAQDARAEIDRYLNENLR